MTEIRILVGTKDFDGASAFYRDTLGFEAVEHWDDPGGRGTLRVLGAGVEIVEALGVRPWGHRNFEIRDPHGLRLVYFAPVADTGDNAEAR